MQGLQQCILIRIGKGICRNYYANGLFVIDSLANRRAIVSGTDHNDLEVQSIEVSGYLELRLFRGWNSGRANENDVSRIAARGRNQHQAKDGPRNA
jgi:hypothetical protein